MFRLTTTHRKVGRNPSAVGSAVGIAPLLRPLIVLLAITGLALGHAQSEPVRVVATIGMIGDLATEIGANCANVTTLMGPGIDPHLYQATSGDVRDLGRAELILYAGLTLEGQLGEVLGRFAERTPTVAVAEAAVAPEDRILTSDAYGVDPHVWMDLSLWRGVVPVVADALISVVPDCESGIRERAAGLETQISALHVWAAEAIASVPEGQRVLVTAHDAFHYYGRAYGVDVVGIQGVSTEAEPSIADIRATAETIAEAGVPAVFVETTINQRTVQAVLDAARDLGHEARLGGSLYSDAMGEPGTADGTYIGMLRANTVAITQALGGTVPPLPDELASWAQRFGVPMEVPDMPASPADDGGS